MIGVRRLAAPIVMAAGLALAACGSDPPMTPTPAELRVTSIQPASGTSFGGTAVTISGAAFAAGAAVTIGGAAATSIVVVNDRTITANTPPHVAGAADVVVAVAGRQSSIAGAFTFVAPTAGPNTPPVIQTLRAQGSRLRQPASMADLGEPIAVSATVTDAETADGALTFEWTATLGTFQGTGAAITWQAPASLPSTPVTALLTLTVVERYVEAGPGGLPVAREHRVAQTLEVRVHDSAREIAAMGKLFLENFSRNEVSALTTVQDFLFTCDGGAGSVEFHDVEDVRATRVILTSSVGDPSPVPTIGFGNVCFLAESKFGTADACAFYPVRWVSREIATGSIEDTQGIDMVTGVYANRRWHLCHSFYLASNGKPARIKR